MYTNIHLGMCIYIQIYCICSKVYTSCLFILVTQSYKYKIWNSLFLTLFLKHVISIFLFAISNGFLIIFCVFVSTELNLDIHASNNFHIKCIQCIVFTWLWFCISKHQKFFFYILETSHNHNPYLN